MITSETMHSKFLSWNYLADNYPKQTFSIWTELNISPGEAKDKVTGEFIPNAYPLLYTFPITAHGDNKQDIMLEATYQTLYLINFSPSKSTIEDFIKLYDQSKNSLEIAFKNRLKSAGLKEIKLQFSLPHAMKAIEKLFEVDLPKKNLR